MTQKAEYVPIIRWWDLWIAIFMLAAIVMVAGRLWVTEWTGELQLLVYLAFLGGLTGLALGYSQFSSLVSALVSTYYGIFTIAWLFGTTVQMEMTWRDRILNYIGWRLRLAIEQFNAGTTINDPILFLTVMAILIWILSTSSAFILVRGGSVWPSLIPLGVTLLVIGHYDPNTSVNTSYLMTFLFFTLVISGRMAFLRYRQKWRQEGIQTTTEIQSDLSKTLIILVSILVLITWIIPVTPQQMTRYSDLWEIITEPWERLSDQFSDIFIVDGTQSTLTSRYFGESMRLGNGTPSSEQTVFTVTTDSELPIGYRNYWRARSYDYYSEADWSTGAGLPEKLLFPDNFNLQYPDWGEEQIATFKFNNLISRMVNIYAPGNPIWVDRPTEAITHPLSNTEEDLISLIANPEVVSGEMYQVDTQIRLPTENALRASSTDYPLPLERYLQLPPDFSSEIAALAEEITFRYGNPYDKAEAITRYLRDNIEYSRTIPDVPMGDDPIEWFLFRGKIGFCNYYATAQVLMLRSIGIPARIAVGYAQGEFDSQTQSFIVRRRDSHAWPEVYFVDHGWVIFEPTTAQPTFTLPAGLPLIEEDSAPFRSENIPLNDPSLEGPDSPDENLLEPDLEENASSPIRSFFMANATRIAWLIFTLFLLTLITALVIFTWPSNFKLNIDPLPVLMERTLIKWKVNVPNWLHRWSVRAQFSAAERAYGQLGQSIKIMGKPLNLAETPVERAQTLIGLLPGAEGPAHQIINEYHLDKYSNHFISEERAKKAGRLVRLLAIKARLRNMLNFRKDD